MSCSLSVRMQTCQTAADLWASLLNSSKTENHEDFPLDFCLCAHVHVVVFCFHCVEKLPKSVGLTEELCSTYGSLSVLQ